MVGEERNTGIRVTEENESEMCDIIVIRVRLDQKLKKKKNK